MAKGRNLLLVGAAVTIGLAATFMANAYFSGVEERQAQVAQQQQLTRIVVAANDLPFGTVLNEQNLKLVGWPAVSVPAGAFTTLAEATRGGQATIRAIVRGEPVLASKLSGRPTLSANLPKGQFAVAVPISAATAAGGFVRPGDIVDVLLTRQMPGDNAGNQDKMTDVVLAAIPVLAVDVDANDKSTGPAVGKTATLQVDTLGAQKLALSQQLGILSLALRNAADATVTSSSTVIPPQLSARNYRIGAPRASAPSAPAARIAPMRVNLTLPRVDTPAPRPVGLLMSVFRGNERSEYEVQRGY
ncbi:MAG: pilus assembly protein CpaB [Novosphingobium lindaniclasticum]|jgi:pilus assembly protein CpaB|uniref:Flp pilus assembly protein CpaB n=1 Tax=Novosphingobium lindaniclasticum TaxID=1329895 RepID=UPI00240A6AFA|nr:Flp pilus assembly protein CpaB [Novosphingobium lindaniclasticum]MDF2639914.1 pilus assembly protein CpaB [Novosphingobium lindaniclasticum]